MNNPGARSASAPPCIRPKSTVPKTTSLRPDEAANTRAQAKWQILAALMPNSRARRAGVTKRSVKACNVPRRSASHRHERREAQTEPSAHPHRLTAR